MGIAKYRHWIHFALIFHLANSNLQLAITVQLQINN